MRASVGSGVTETQHVNDTPVTSHRRETRRVVEPLIALEAVEQPAIEHRVERAIETIQVQGIGSRELRVETAIRSLLPGERQRGLGHVHAKNLEPERRYEKGVLARSAPGIKDGAGEGAFARQTDHRRLWLADVPGWRGTKVGRVPRLARPPLVNGWPAPAVRIVGHAD